MTGETPPDTRKRNRLRAAVVFLFWTLVGLASAAQSHVTAAMEGSPAPFWLSMLRSVPVWWFWVPATPAIAWLGRRARVERGGWPRAVIVHLGASVVATLLHAVWLLGLFTLLGVTAQMTETRMEFLRILFLSRLYLDVLTYWAVLGGAYAFEYHDRYRERELRASRLEVQLARARLDALRMQLNPHFLFNALNAVAAQVRGGRPDAAVTMLGGLGDLLRYALESSDELLVPLWQELAFLERYLEIERVRFEDRLEVRVHVPAELHDALVPALLLQPLVENAVRHGIAPRDASGRVEVEAHRDADDLVVAVRDDGVGLGAGDRAAGKTAAGVGLTNTRARLEQLFGDRYALVIAARAGGGVEVEVRVPWKVDGDMS